MGISERVKKGSRKEKRCIVADVKKKEKSKANVNIVNLWLPFTPICSMMRRK